LAGVIIAPAGNFFLYELRYNKTITKNNGIIRMQATITEADLLQTSQAGGKEAFGPIVERYQALVCAITYSGTGDFLKSRDLAKEAFVRAFKSLGQLRSPHKFRFMLCRIARNLVGKSIRKNRFDVINDAEPPTPLQVDLSEIPVSLERQALVWKAIETIPEKYREPLVFFYQRQPSDPAVAAQLNLAEPALVQYVSKARSMLKPEVASLVHDILAKTAPGKQFTLSVLDELSQVPHPTDQTRKSPPPPQAQAVESVEYLYPTGPAPISRKALYGAFAGGIFGGVAWLLPTSIMAKDWISAAAVLVVAGVIFLAATTLCLRNQAKRWQILGWVMIALCALNLTVINLRWTRWMQAYDQNPAYNSPTNLSRWTINIIIAAIMAALLIIFITLDARQRKRPSPGEPPFPVK